MSNDTPAKTDKLKLKWEYSLVGNWHLLLFHSPLSPFSSPLSPLPSPLSPLPSPSSLSPLPSPSPLSPLPSPLSPLPIFCTLFTHLSLFVLGVHSTQHIKPAFLNLSSLLSYRISLGVFCIPVLAPWIQGWDLKSQSSSLLSPAVPR